MCTSELPSWASALAVADISTSVDCTTHQCKNFAVFCQRGLCNRPHPLGDACPPACMQNPHTFHIKAKDLGDLLLVAWTCKVKSENIYLHSLHYLSVERRRAWGGHTPLPCINLPLAHGSLLPRTRHSSGDVLAPPRNHYIGASPSSFPSLSSPPVEPSTHYNPSGVCRRAGAVVEGVGGSAARMLLRLL